MSHPRHRRLAGSGFFLLRGRGISPGRALGPLRRNDPSLDPSRVQGAVLVAEHAVPDDVGRILAASGTLTLQGAPLSHVGLLSREFGKPCVALGADRLGRLRSPATDGSAILELPEVVGAPGAAVLEEDDIVLLDGGTGTVIVPGGLDREARKRVREAHLQLLALREGPGSSTALARLVRVSADDPGAVLPFVLEATFAYEALTDRRSAVALLEALREASSASERTSALVEDLRERIASELRALGDRALEAVRTHDDTISLDRGIEEFRAAATRLHARLEDLGGDPPPLDRILEPARAEAARSRRRVVAIVEADIEAARRFDDPALALRMGEVYRLVRRARAAGIERAAFHDLEEGLERLVARERARSGSRLVIPLDGRAAADRTLLGGKATGLVAIREVLPEGCRIPRGFVIATTAYRLHLLGERGERLRQALAEELDEAALSRRARAILLAGEPLEGLAEEIAAETERLACARFAVRSSATIEDGRAGSLAGLCDSWLGVAGLEALLDRVRWCWASLWNARALRAMSATGASPLDAAQAVLVQEAVPVRAAGVLFTREPAGNPGTMLINATWGLGEAVSSGEVDGDLYWVRRADGTPIATEQGSANLRIALDPDRPGTIELPLPEGAMGRLCLENDDLARLASLARAVEAATGRAQDVEFGFAEDGDLVVFQARRVVTPR